MTYISLAEAAQTIAEQTGVDATPEQLLRAGIASQLRLVSLFSGVMRNLTSHADEDYLGLLQIPPRHLVQMSVDGRDRIVGAFSLDGAACFSPQQVRSVDQLQVLLSDLQEFVSRVERAQAPGAPVEPSTVPRVPLMQANVERVRRALVASGYDPADLPPNPRGRACPAKTAAREGAGLQAAAFEHAWKALPKQRRATRP